MVGFVIGMLNNVPYSRSWRLYQICMNRRRKVAKQRKESVQGKAVENPAIGKRRRCTSSDQRRTLESRRGLAKDYLR